MNQDASGLKDYTAKAENGRFESLGVWVSQPIGRGNPAPTIALNNSVIGVFTLAHVALRLWGFSDTLR